MHCICTILSSVAWPTLPFFSPHFLINGTIIDTKVIEDKMCVSIFSTTSVEIFLILRRIGWDKVKAGYWSSSKVPTILVRLYWNLNFLDRIEKNIQITKFHEKPSSGSPVVACGQTERHIDRRSDVPKLVSAFRNFAIAPKNFTNTRA